MGAVGDLVLDMLLAAAVLAVAWVLGARLRRRIVEHSWGREDLDERLYDALGVGAQAAIVAAGAAAALAQVGVEAAGLVALLAVAGLAVGLAAQGALSNLAAGVLMTLFPPFRGGQMVEAAGHYGEVRSVGLFATELTTPDNRQILIPNAQILASAVVNHSHHGARRVDLIVTLTEAARTDAALSALRDMVEEDHRALEEPAAEAVLLSLSKEGQEVALRVWCHADDYEGLTADLIKGAVAALKTAKIGVKGARRA